MRGRKPIPLNLKILNGNPGKRKLNANEPKPRQGLPKCPPHLDAEAKKEWRRMAPILAEVKILTLADRAAFAAYCQSWSRWVKLEGLVQRLGEVLVEPETKKFYPNPYLGALNRALKNMHAFLSEFGMTPSSRTRINAQINDPAADLDSFARQRERA